MISRDHIPVGLVGSLFELMKNLQDLRVLCVMTLKAVELRVSLDIEAQSERPQTCNLSL